MPPQDAGCVEVDYNGRIDALTLGRTASFYYLKHQSMRVLSQGLHAGMAVPEVSLCSNRRWPVMGVHCIDELAWLYLR